MKEINDKKKTSVFGYFILTIASIIFIIFLSIIIYFQSGIFPCYTKSGFSEDTVHLLNIIDGDFHYNITIVAVSLSIVLYILTKKIRVLFFTLFSFFLLVVIYNLTVDAKIQFAKPAIYIYPKEETKINVQLDIKGELTKVIPEYKENGWDIKVKPNGDMKVIGGNSQITYDYLFYENTVNSVSIPKEGWIVPRKDLKDWFNINLYKLGLNKKEADEFIDYWMDRISIINKKYIRISLYSNEYLKEKMKLTISPKPDKVLRLEFYFEGLDERIDMKEPIIKTFERTGYYAVEWGGSLNETN